MEELNALVEERVNQSLAKFLRDMEEQPGELSLGGERSSIELEQSLSQVEEADVEDSTAHQPSSVQPSSSSAASSPSRSDSTDSSDDDSHQSSPPREATDTPSATADNGPTAAMLEVEAMFQNLTKLDDESVVFKDPCIIPRGGKGTLIQKARAHDIPLSLLTYEKQFENNPAAAMDPRRPSRASSKGSAGSGGGSTPRSALQSRAVGGRGFSEVTMQSFLHSIQEERPELAGDASNMGKGIVKHPHPFQTIGAPGRKKPKRSREATFRQRWFMKPEDWGKADEQLSLSRVKFRDEFWEKEREELDERQRLVDCALPSS
jgi:hypothetical protein